MSDEVASSYPAAAPSDGPHGSGRRKGRGASTEPSVVTVVLTLVAATVVSVLVGTGTLAIRGQSYLSQARAARVQGDAISSVLAARAALECRVPGFAFGDEARTLLEELEDGFRRSDQDSLRLAASRARTAAEFELRAPTLPVSPGIGPRSIVEDGILAAGAAALVALLMNRWRRGTSARGVSSRSAVL